MAKEYNIGTDPDVVAKLEAMNERPVLSKESSFTAIEAIELSIKAMKGIAERLAKADYENMDPEKAAKSFSYVTKAMDETVRLMEYARGNPDHRTAFTLDDVFAKLKDEQIRLLREWLKEAEITIQ